MLSRSRIIQLACIAVAVCCLTAAGYLQGVLDKQNAEHQLNLTEIVENHPAKALLTMAPGGLRAPLVNYLWIRAESLKDKGKHYEAMQLADLICQLQPHFPGVWSFHAWNMAWNISVTTHTPQERWLWIHNAIKLLRDRGIPINRHSLTLYRELGWIYYNKMGGYMDEMHMSYKRRWAALMQRVVGAPPSGTTEEAIAAFRLIADAALDKDYRHQGRQTIQPDQLQLLLDDAEVAAYVRLLDEQGIAVGEQLLDAYNRFSLDELAQAVRLGPPRPSAEDELKLSALINSEAHTSARRKLLAFVRAQVLWNVYKLDPDWMLQLMERYGPIDWRVSQMHGLYWATYGLHVCESLELGDMNTLNTDRIVLNSLQEATFQGRWSYIENKQKPDEPWIQWNSDWRFIDAVHAEYIRLGEFTSKARGTSFRKSQFSVNHINFLSRAIAMLYASGRMQKAGELMEWVKKHYAPSDRVWYMDLEDLVISFLNPDGAPSKALARSQITASLQTAYLNLTHGNKKKYRKSIAYAKRVYRVYQKDVPKRNALPELAILAREELRKILVEPRIIGVMLPLEDRSNLYMSLDDRMQRMLFPLIAMPLHRQCQLENIDPRKAFPMPPGLAEELRRTQGAAGKSLVR